MAHERVRDILDAWGRPWGVQCEWVEDRVITYTDSRGARHLSTVAINRDDDWISGHPGDGESVELQLVASAGHVEIRRLSINELADELAHVLPWFREWTAFFAAGPGSGR